MQTYNKNDSRGRNMKGMQFALLMAMGFLSVRCDADQLGYQYLEADYASPSQNLLSDGKGYGIGASIDLVRSTFLSASYTHDLYHGVGTTEPAESGYRLGVGWHYGLSDSTDLVTRLSYAQGHLWVHASGALFDFPANSGYDVGAGVRTKLASSLELAAFFDHDTVGVEYGPSSCAGACALQAGSGASENIASVGLFYAVWSHLSLVMQYSRSSNESATRWQASARWYFGE